MCGINGIISFSNNNIGNDIHLMNNKILHRGPDEYGLFEKNTASRYCKSG